MLPGTVSAVLDELFARANSAVEHRPWPPHLVRRMATRRPPFHRRCNAAGRTHCRPRCDRCPWPFAYISEMTMSIVVGRGLEEDTLCWPGSSVPTRRCAASITVARSRSAGTSDRSTSGTTERRAAREMGRPPEAGTAARGHRRLPLCCSRLPRRPRQRDPRFELATVGFGSARRPSASASNPRRGGGVVDVYPR